MKSPRNLAAVTQALAAVFAFAPPAPQTPVPRDPAVVAEELTETEAALRAAIGEWKPKSASPPRDVVLYALYQQRIYRVLARDNKLSGNTLRLLGRRVRTVSRDLLAAQRELYRLTPPLAPRAIKVGPPPPAAELLADYREAERRFKVSWTLLAAVNFVESKFGKLRSNSAAGAQGPMQFMPATWRRYGLSGNVHDPHDAILGAANYLRASGALHKVRRALHAYNPSRAYVDAVLRYARVIRGDRAMFYELYNWQVFVKTPRGDRRVTGP
jgi:membrane-bound lytic murein transglycosylase B